jgi:hypothetical protein
MTSPGLPAIAPFAQLTASTIAELRDLLLQHDLPLAIDNERAIAIKEALDAQRDEIAHLRLENSILTQRHDSLIQSSRVFAHRYLERISACFREQATVISSLHGRISACVSSLNRPLRSDTEALRKELAEKTAELEMMKARPPDAESGAVFSEHMDWFQQNYREVSDENTALKQRIVELTQALNSTTKAKSVLNSANLELSARIEELEGRIANPQVVAEVDLQQQIRELTQSLDKSHETYQERIRLLGEQLGAAMRHGEGLKNQLSESREETVELHRKLAVGSAELASATRKSRTLQRKIEDQEREIAHQNEVIAQIQAQKEELQTSWQDLLEQHQRKKADNEIFLTSLSGIFGCEQGDVARRISDSLTELARAKEQIADSFEKERENSLLRSRISSLEQRLALANEQIDGLGRQMALLKAGKESEVVSQIHADFFKLKAVNSDLYNEHIKLQEEFFRAEKSLTNTMAMLETQQNANHKLSERLVRFDFYDFLFRQLACLLAELSSRMVSSLSATPARHRQLEAVDSLIIALRQQNCSADRAKGPWDGFADVLMELFSNDNSKIEVVLRRRLDSFMGGACRQLACCQDRIGVQLRSIGDLTLRVAQIRRPPPRSQIPIFARAVRPPIPSKKFAERSPLTPSGQRGDVLGLTPRLNPSSNFDSIVRRFN